MPGRAAEQIRSLRPKLGRFLAQFDDYFLRSDTRSHLPVYAEGLTLDEGYAKSPVFLDAVRGRLQEFVTEVPVTFTG